MNSQEKIYLGRLSNSEILEEIAKDDPALIFILFAI